LKLFSLNLDIEGSTKDVFAKLFKITN